MRSSAGRWRRRRGGIAIVAAMVLLVAISLTALAVDLSVLSLARSEIRTAADAAALAGAIELASSRRLAGAADLDQELAQARERARQIGQANRALDAPILIPDNPTNSAQGSLVVGYLDRAAGDAFRTDPAWTSQYDTFQATARRDGQHGGQIPAFFSQVMGHRGFDAIATARATVRNYKVAGFRSTPAGSTTLIPIALSLDLYTRMVNRQTSDSYRVLRDPTQVQAGADGIFESSLFPQSSGSGNWGTVRIGTSNNGTSFLASQIAGGVTTGQVAAEGPGGVLSASPYLMLGGNPGVSLGIKSALQGIVGKDVIVPIYDPAGSTDSGSNFRYKIVQFAAVTVLAFEAKGVNSTLLVQPAYSRDPTAIAGDPQPDWTAGGLIRLSLTQ